jgi:NadR type nicotinamide-nucleotide adenylyltransferase
VIGKFYPFHLGHDRLIAVAKEQVDEVVVLCCAHARQAIPGEVRARWIRESHPDVTVLEVEDDLPEAPAPWAARTVEVLGRQPDLVFTSEDYGNEYAELMGARHISVDPGWRDFPISGTQLRGDLGAHWPMLAPGAKAGLARRVCVIGAESTGTTTLAQDLARPFATCWVPEFGRSYWEGRRYLKAADSWSEDEFVRIALGQQRQEDDLARRANKVLICDTDAIATHMWHRHYRGTYSDRVLELARLRTYVLYLVTCPDFPFVQDGTRDGDPYRHRMHEWLLEILEAEGRPFEVMTGGPTERLQRAVELVDPLTRFDPLEDLSSDEGPGEEGER